jgi:enoyl-CoA hydratase
VSVLIDQRDAVLVITINRPEVRNALDAETMAGIGEALVAAETDDSVGAVVLTGAGDRSFCAGMDLRAFAAGGEMIDKSRPGLEVFTDRVYPKPIICAAAGTAVAGGFELLLACDLAVVADHAKFGLPEVKRGLVAAGGGTRLPRRIPLALALELALTGEIVSAQRVFELGLVNRVVPGADVLDEAIALATTIAENGPLALRITKQLMVTEAAGMSAAQIAEASAPAFASADAKEGAVAFAEKRKPRWTGK